MMPLARHTRRPVRGSRARCLAPRGGGPRDVRFHGLRHTFGTDGRRRRSASNAACRLGGATRRRLPARPAPCAPRRRPAPHRRRRDDALGGGAARRHPAPARPAVRDCASTSRPSRRRRPSRSSARRFGSNASPSPTTTSTRSPVPTVRPAPEVSNRLPSPRNMPAVRSGARPSTRRSRCGRSARTACAPPPGPARRPGRRSARP